MLLRPAINILRTSNSWDTLGVLHLHNEWNKEKPGVMEMMVIVRPYLEQMAVKGLSHASH